MSRTIINFWLDLALLVTFLATFWCTFIIRFVFPPGTSAHGWMLWGWSYDQWFAIQFGLMCAFAFEALIHVMLHWTWVCGVITSKFWKGDKKRSWTDGEQTLIGVGFMVVAFNVLGIAFAAAVLMVQKP